MQNADTEQQIDIFKQVLELVLLPESLARFVKRFADLEEPIELEQASDVVAWLMERYGRRPTQLSSPSASGQDSPASGTNSTDAQPRQVSIPPTFQPTAG